VLKDGTELIALGEEQQAEGRAWLRVKDASGTEGWVASEFAVTVERS
jgi:SH3-like domain-containing protein